MDDEIEYPTLEEVAFFSKNRRYLDKLVNDVINNSHPSPNMIESVLSTLICLSKIISIEKQYKRLSDFYAKMNEERAGVFDGLYADCLPDYRL